MSDPEYLRAAYEISMGNDSAPDDAMVKRAMDEARGAWVRGARADNPLGGAHSALVCLWDHVATLTAQLEVERAMLARTLNEARGTADMLLAELDKTKDLTDRLARETARADAAVAEAKALREAVPYSPLFPNWREELAPISGTDADNMHDALRLQHPAAADAIVKLWNDRERLEIALNSLLPYCRATLAQPAADGGK